jgi:hypothetical protein
VNKRALEEERMKSNINVKILRLAVVEILSQCGFERTTEQTLNVLVDVLNYYIEQLAIRMGGKQSRGISPEHIYRAVIDEMYGKCTYQIPELLAFLKYQINLKNYLLEKYDIGCEESLLHTIRVLPKNVQLRGVLRSSKAVGNVNEMQEESMHGSIKIDKFMEDFISSSLSEQSRREVGMYSHQVMDLVNFRPRRAVEMSERMFNELLEHKRKARFLREPSSLLDDLEPWRDRKVFKG